MASLQTYHVLRPGDPALRTASTNSDHPAIHGPIGVHSSTLASGPSVGIDRKTSTFTRVDLSMSNHTTDWLVFGKVAQEIGDDWRNLARQLPGILVGEIEEIDFEMGFDSMVAARYVLETFRYRNPGDDHLWRLTDALKAIRRHHLASKIRMLTLEHGLDIRFRGTESS